MHEGYSIMQFQYCTDKKICIKLNIVERNREENKYEGFIN